MCFSQTYSVDIKAFSFFDYDNSLSHITHGDLKKNRVDKKKC